MTGDWTVRGELVHAAAQGKVPAGDTRTEGYTLVNLSVSSGLKMVGLDGLLFVKLNNLGNTLAYNAASISTVRSLRAAAGALADGRCEAGLLTLRCPGWRRQGASRSRTQWPASSR